MDRELDTENVENKDIIKKLSDALQLKIVPQTKARLVVCALNRLEIPNFALTPDALVITMLELFSDAKEEQFKEKIASRLGLMGKHQCEIDEILWSFRELANVLNADSPILQLQLKIIAEIQSRLSPGLLQAIHQLDVRPDLLQPADGKGNNGGRSETEHKVKQSNKLTINANFNPPLRKLPIDSESLFHNNKSASSDFYFRNMQVQYLELNGLVRFVGDEMACCVAIPFAESKLELLLLLPHVVFGEDQLEKLMREMSVERLINYLPQTKMPLCIQFPAFEVDSTVSWQELLSIFDVDSILKPESTVLNEKRRRELTCFGHTLEMVNVKVNESGLRLNSEVLFPTVGHKPPVGTIDDRSELPSPVATIKFDRPFIFAVEQYRDDDIGTHCLCFGCYRGDQAEGLHIFPSSTPAGISRSEYYKAKPSEGK